MCQKGQFTLQPCQRRWFVRKIFVLPVKKGGFKETACPKDRLDRSWLSPSSQMWTPLRIWALPFFETFPSQAVHTFTVNISTRANNGVYISLCKYDTNKECLSNVNLVSVFLLNSTVLENSKTIPTIFKWLDVYSGSSLLNEDIYEILKQSEWISFWHTYEASFWLWPKVWMQRCEMSASNWTHKIPKKNPVYSLI